MTTNGSRLTTTGSCPNCATLAATVAALEQRLARAEELAGLVPDPNLLLRLANASVCVANCTVSTIRGSISAQNDADEARALAARIEEAQGEAGGGD